MCSLPLYFTILHAILLIHATPGLGGAVTLPPDTEALQQLLETLPKLASVYVCGDEQWLYPPDADLRLLALRSVLSCAVLPSLPLGHAGPFHLLAAENRTSLRILEEQEQLDGFQLSRGHAMAAFAAFNGACFPSSVGSH